MKKAISILLVLVMSFSICACSVTTENQYSPDGDSSIPTAPQKPSESENKVVYDGLYTARKEFEFISKYAGNVNSVGSRKFADERISALRNALQDVDIDYINSNLPQTAAVLQTIQANITTVANMLVDMGNTNSAANVPQIKQLSKDTIALIDQLFDSELSAYAC